LERRLRADEIGHGHAAPRLSGKELFPGGDGALLRHRLSEAALEIVATLAFEITALADLVECRLAECSNDALGVLVGGGEIGASSKHLVAAAQDPARLSHVPSLGHPHPPRHSECCGPSLSGNRRDPRPASSVPQARSQPIVSTLSAAPPSSMRKSLGVVQWHALVSRSPRYAARTA